MYWSFVIFLSFLLSSVSTKPKLCINCKHFIDNSALGEVYGKCGLFPAYNSGSELLVTGNKKEIVFKYASIARSESHLCGMEGKHFVRKYKKRTPK